jgi:hypothetical protein
MDELDRAENNYLLEDETFPDALAPTPTPRSPEPEPKKPPRKSVANIAYYIPRFIPEKVAETS